MVVPIRTGPGVSDVDAVMEGAVRTLDAAVPNAGRIDICPFATDGGHSSCAAALTDRRTRPLDPSLLASSGRPPGARDWVRSRGGDGVAFCVSAKF